MVASLLDVPVPQNRQDRMSSTDTAQSSSPAARGGSSARLAVVTGPQRGQALEMTAEIVHIGATADCALFLNDPQLEGRLVSICLKNGRHAIYVTGTDEVEVDSTRIPPDRWVWMPRACSIQVTRRSNLEFESLIAPSEADYDAQPSSPPVERKSSSTNPRLPAGAAGGKPLPAAPSAAPPQAGEEPAKRTGKKETKTKQVARFLTDQAGDPLVKLGADGHLPELQLQEGGVSTKKKSTTEESAAPIGLIAAFCVSVGLSMLMLFVDFEAGGGGSQSRASAARASLAIFYATDAPGTTPEPYQVLLRRAQQAHTKGDTATERNLYREVLRMLRAENRSALTGITRLTPDAQSKFNALTVKQLQLLGNSSSSFLDLKNDERLERVLSILLE